MRFRRREWDIPVPDALVAYWAAWNEHDLERIRNHLARAVTVDGFFGDPTPLGANDGPAAAESLPG